jgi:hypothetical protein
MDRICRKALLLQWCFAHQVACTIDVVQLERELQSVKRKDNLQFDNIVLAKI